MITANGLKKKQNKDMKTKEEIERLAKEEYKDNLHNPFFTAAPMGYIKGYSQCQEDMADKKYTLEDLKETFRQSRQAKIFEKGMPPVWESFEDYINSLHQENLEMQHTKNGKDN
jgi:hypothetical protein